MRPGNNHSSRDRVAVCESPAHAAQSLTCRTSFLLPSTAGICGRIDCKVYDQLGPRCPLLPLVSLHPLCLQRSADEHRRAIGCGYLT